jgi:hypothetical protein
VSNFGLSILECSAGKKGGIYRDWSGPLMAKLCDPACQSSYSHLLTASLPVIHRFPGVNKYANEWKFESTSNFFFQSRC